VITAITHSAATKISARRFLIVGRAGVSGMDAKTT
jgi:hypothetical protein